MKEPDLSAYRCVACRKRLKRHCKRCGVCRPVEVSHPDWCPVEVKRRKRARHVWVDEHLLIGWRTMSGS